MNYKDNTASEVEPPKISELGHVGDKLSANVDEIFARVETLIKILDPILSPLKNDENLKDEIGYQSAYAQFLGDKVSKLESCNRQLEKLVKRIEI